VRIGCLWRSGKGFYPEWQYVVQYVTLDWTVPPELNMATLHEIFPGWFPGQAIFLGQLAPLISQPIINFMAYLKSQALVNRPKNTKGLKVRIHQEIQNIMPQLLSSHGRFQCCMEQCVEMRGGNLLETIFKS
jgi:hypothetical protein